MQAETTYNWDDIEVGRFDLNHSENFFTQKHFKHEKFSEEFHLIQAMATSNLNESFSNGIGIKSEDKENADPENKENNEPVTNQQEKQAFDAPLSAAKEEVKLETEIFKAPISKPSTLLTTSNSKRRPANLMTRPKTPQPELKSNGPGTVKSAGKAVTKVEPPHVYDFKDIYQKKKEEKMKKLLEEEKKNRIFHSRPVPKSVAMPREPLARKNHVPSKMTVAKTPVVLKNSREAQEKHKQRLEEWKKNHPPVQFTSREAAVLHEEPFKPKKSGQTVQMQPFNLHVERRLEERKQYDEHQRRTVEEKKKQEEEERKKREEELVKELRKLASFKARPNPFK